MTLANQDIGFDPARPMMRGDDHTLRASITISVDVDDWLTPTSAVYQWLTDDPEDGVDLEAELAVTLGTMTIEQNDTGVVVTIPIPSALTNQLDAGVYYHELELVSESGVRGTAFTGHAKLTADA